MGGFRIARHGARAAAVSIATVALTAALPASAQNAGAPDQSTATATSAEGTEQTAAQAPSKPSPQSTAPEDIIVTAQKRSERLQDVPISVAVVGGDTLSKLHLTQSTDLQYVVPGVAAPVESGPRNFGFFIRGIGTNTFAAETIEPSTAYAVDGVVMGQAGATLADLPDIERIEVLRGPQSTLFGKNASAGVINITTLAPSDHLVFRGGMSDAWPDNDMHAYAYVSGPISDALGFSLSGRRSVRQGYILNVPDRRDFNDRNETGVRGKLRWQPSSKLTATLIGDYWKSDTNCCIWTVDRFGSPAGAGLLYYEPYSIAYLGTDEPGRDNQKQTIDGDVFAHVRSYGASLQLDYDMGGYTLTSISAYRGFKTKDGLDSDSSPVDFLNVNYADFRQHQISQELRLASPTGGFVDYVAGLYYFRQHIKDHVEQLFPALPGYTAIPDANGNPTYPFLYLNKSPFLDTVTTTNYAAFGQINVHPTDKIVLTAGGRVLRETQHVDKSLTDPTVAMTLNSHGRMRDSYITYRFAAEYHFTHDLMAFASVTRGYKGGGFDPFALPTLKQVGPEKPLAYEAGLRTSFPDAGLTFNITGYWEKIDGYQTASRDPVTLTFPITNGNAKTRGFEAEAVWRPVGRSDFDLNLGVAYTDAEWGRFPDAPCAGGQTAAQGCVGGVQDLTGQPLPFAPRWAFNIGPDFSHPIGNNLKISATGNLNYRSRQIIGFPNSPDAREPGYWLLGASIGIGAVDDTWKVSVFGKNLTDEHFRTFQFNTSNGSSYDYRVYESRRIIGVSLDVAL